MYDLYLSDIRGLIEEWTAIGVNADVHGNAVLRMHQRLPADYESAKQATIYFWADTMRNEL